MPQKMNDFANKNSSDSDQHVRVDQINHSSDLSTVPGYLELVEYYQHGQFTKCMDQFEGLVKAYPGHPELLRFKEEIDLKLSFRAMAVSNKKVKIHKKVKGTFRMTVLAIASTVFVLMVFIFSYYYLRQSTTAKQLEEEQVHLESLNTQADGLLLGGQPDAALEIIARINAINPDYENLSALESRASELLILEDRYDTALRLAAEENYYDALEILEEIDAEKSGLWDINQQTAKIENMIQINEYKLEGAAAYQEENWDQVIIAYENVLLLEPEVDDLVMKEQLLNSYLNMIINLLQSDGGSVEDIETAEEYYRRAVALIPQNKEFASERGNLEEVSSNLLELKFTQTAKAMLEDKNQTASTIARAVSYFEKAISIDSNNSALQLDLTNAEYYQIAFQYFVDMNWTQAITNLNQVLSVDSDYANGNASSLLFEAYFALGKQYYSSSFYQDALTNLEQAEVLAWDDSDNLLKLFQVQILIGETYSAMYDYENAVSYYQYAMNAIELLSRLTEYPEMAVKFSEATVLMEAGSYQAAAAAFEEVLETIDVIYKVVEVEIDDGVCLAFFADQNFSTVDAILEANGLSTNMVITFGRSLEVPMIEE